MITIRGQPKLCLKLWWLVFWQCAQSKFLTNNIQLKSNLGAWRDAPEVSVRLVRSHCRSDQLDQGRSSQITHFTQSKLDQMLDRTSTRALPDRYSIVYDPHPTIHDSSRTSPRQPRRFLLEHTDLYTINTRSINGQYSNSTRPPRPTRRLHDLYKILTRACPSPSKIRLELTI